MNIKPLFDRVVVKELEAENKTSGGLYLPTSAQEKPCIAKVLAVGEGEVINGVLQEMKVKVGDKIIFAKYSGSEFKLDGQEYIVLKQTDILGILEVATAISSSVGI